MRKDSNAQLGDEVTYQVNNDKSYEVENTITTTNQTIPLLDVNANRQTTIQLAEAVSRYGSGGSHFYKVDTTNSTADLWILKAPLVNNAVINTFVTPNGLFEGMKINFIAHDYNKPTANDLKIRILSANVNGNIGDYTQVGDDLEVWDNIPPNNRSEVPPVGGDNNSTRKTFDGWFRISRFDILKNKICKLVVCKDDNGFFLVHTNRDVTPTLSVVDSFYYYMTSDEPFVIQPDKSNVARYQTDEGVELTLPGYLCASFGNVMYFYIAQYPRLYSIWQKNKFEQKSSIIYASNRSKPNNQESTLNLGASGSAYKHHYVGRFIKT